MSFSEKDMRLMRKYNPAPWQITDYSYDPTIRINDANGFKVCDIPSVSFATRTHQRRVANAIVEAVNKFLTEAVE